MRIGKKLISKRDRERHRGNGNGDLTTEGTEKWIGKKRRGKRDRERQRGNGKEDLTTENTEGYSLMHVILYFWSIFVYIIIILDLLLFTLII